VKTAEYTSFDATGLAECVERRDVTAAELVDCAIAMIEERNPALNAVIHEHFERAREFAADAPAVGPFAGVPFLLKDLGGGHRAGDPIHFGTRVMKHAKHRAATTSYLVEDFEAAGLIVVGRTNVPELGAWTTTEPEAYGPTRNPWNTDHSSGGSSGGSAAAVAAGIVPLAHASDGGGSIRIPASECGLIGLKPTRGRISLGPDVGEAWGGLVSEFAVTRSVRDTARLLDAVAKPRAGDPYSIAPPARAYAREVGAPCGRLRIGFSTAMQGNPIDPECRNAVEAAARALEDRGHSIEEARPDGLEANPEFTEAMVTVIASHQARDVERLGAYRGREISEGELDPDNWLVTTAGQEMSATRYLKALEKLHAAHRQAAGWWQQGFDLLITPTLTNPPPKIGVLVPHTDRPLDAFQRSGNQAGFTAPFNVTGQPAISLPLHWSADGLPVGVQFVAATGREDLLLRVASDLEPAEGWRCPAP
jgi:amidase